MIEEEDEVFDNIRLEPGTSRAKSSEMQSEKETEQTFKFSKEFLYAIQAEIDEVGNYVWLDRPERSQPSGSLII